MGHLHGFVPQEFGTRTLLLGFWSLTSASHGQLPTLTVGRGPASPPDSPPPTQEPDKCTLFQHTEKTSAWCVAGIQGRRLRMSSLATDWSKFWEPAH